MKICKFFFLFVTLGLFAGVAEASPFPGFGSSETQNFYRISPWIHLGIQWNINPQDWERSELTSEGLRFENPRIKQSLDIKLISSQGALSSSLSAKNYNQFGFNLLSSKLGGAIEVIDLFHRDQKTQVRQYLFRKTKQPFLMTCSSSPQIFSNTVSKCNSIALGIIWKPLSTEPALKFGSHTSDKTSIRR